MKKSIKLMSACLAAIMVSAVPFSAGAAGASHDGSYVHYVQLDRYAMTAEEAAQGNISIGASVYLRGSANDSIMFTSGTSGLTSDSALYMRDLVNMSMTGEENTYSCLGESFNTKYTPFCFGKLSGGKYTPNSAGYTGRSVCMDPVNGGELVYMGNDTIKFSLPGRFYIDENGNYLDDKVNHEITLPLEIMADGSAQYTFTYANIGKNPDGTKKVEPATAVGKIAYYQPELLEVGGSIPDTNSMIVWLGDIMSGAKFLGNSDDFPFMKTNVYVKKDSTCGIYAVNIDEKNSSILANVNGKSTTLEKSCQGAAIAVGVTSASYKVDTGTPMYACFFADDDKVITGPKTGYNYICDVSYSDGTSETDKYVTGAVNAGVSPAQLFAQAGNNYYIGDVQMNCGDTPITGANLRVLLGVKGDVNFDSKADLADATKVLEYYAQKAAGLNPSLTGNEDADLEILAFFLGDIDTESQTGASGGKLDLTDASSILTYYANTAAGNSVTWDAFLK